MTLQAQNALRRIIEKYTRNVRFCIICNYINKLSPAIQSRTTKFRFSPLSTPSISARLDYIIEAESVSITPAGKEALLKLSSGDMRRAVNVLQACASAYDTIDEEEIYMCVGMIMPADTERIVQSMLSEEFGTCLRSISLCSLTHVRYKYSEITERSCVAGYSRGCLRGAAGSRVGATIENHNPRSFSNNRIPTKHGSDRTNTSQCHGRRRKNSDRLGK